MADLHTNPPACACGCGNPVNRRVKNVLRFGVWRRYLKGHNSAKDRKGYPTTMDGRKNVRIHVLRAERALGKSLPLGAVVHHADGTKQAEAPLVICQDQGYHLLLHKRFRVVMAGGNPDQDAVCSSCRRARPRSEFYARRTATTYQPIGAPTSMCKECSRTSAALRRQQ